MSGEEKHNKSTGILLKSCLFHPQKHYSENTRHACRVFSICLLFGEYGLPLLLLVFWASFSGSWDWSFPDLGLGQRNSLI